MQDCWFIKDLKKYVANMGAPKNILDEKSNDDHHDGIRFFFIHY